MIEHIQTNKKDIYLLGTAHVSQQSIDAVEAAIDEYQPDTICVELCSSRYNAWADKKKWQNLDIIKVIKEKKVAVLCINLLLSAYQKKIGKDIQVNPGSEMFQAIQIAEKKNIEIHLADRDVQVTLNRLLAHLTSFEKAKLFMYFLSSLFTKEEEVKEKDINSMLKNDLVTELVEELSKSFPNIKKVIIDERDQIIAENINQAEGKTIVAVVGAGHLNGIKKYIDKDNDIDEINSFTKKKLIFSTMLKWCIPILVIGLITYGFFTFDKDVSYTMIMNWILLNGVLAALGALLSSAHIITVIVAFVSAPITSLNPMIATGWVSGLTEAYLRKPKVMDFQKLSDDVYSIKGLRKNNVTRVLAVVLLTNTGSTIGTFLGTYSIMSLL